jgi:hypothetical protein
MAQKQKMHAGCHFWPSTMPTMSHRLTEIQQCRAHLLTESGRNRSSSSYEGARELRLRVLCLGRIAAVDFDDEHGRYFQLVLNDGDGLYRMQYDAVLNYADEEHPTFHFF